MRPKFGHASAYLIQAEAYVALSLISLDLGDMAVARKYASLALEVADQQRSDLRYHPTVGVVGETYAHLRTIIAELAKD